MTKDIGVNGNLLNVFMMRQMGIFDPSSISPSTTPAPSNK